VDNDRLMDDLQSASIPLLVENHSWFDLRLESVSYRVSLLGADPVDSAQCPDRQHLDKDIPKDTTTAVEVPLCRSSSMLKQHLEDLRGGYRQSAVDISITAKVLGRTVTKPVVSASASFTPEIVLSAFGLEGKKPRPSHLDAVSAKKRRPRQAAQARPEQPCDLRDSNGECKTSEADSSQDTLDRAVQDLCREAKKLGLPCEEQ